MREGKTYSSGQLVEMIRQGGNMENDALSFILNHNRNSVSKYVRANSGQEEDAEDLMQESLIALREKVKLDSFKQVSSLHNYFFGINKNQWLKVLRKRQIQVELDAIRERKMPEDSFGELIRESLLARDGWLKEEMAKLGKNCREVLLAKASGQRSEDIAEDLGLAGKTVVDTIATRCRRKLELHVYGILGETCKKILSLYIPEKRKANRQGVRDMTQVYAALTDTLSYSSVEELIQTKNNCMKQLYQVLFPDS